MDKGAITALDTVEGSPGEYIVSRSSNKEAFLVILLLLEFKIPSYISLTVPAISLAVVMVDAAFYIVGWKF